jgi:hypothetical protein
MLYTARLFDMEGAELSGRSVTWRTNDTTVAQVDVTGEVTGVGAGSTTVTATSQGVVGEAKIVVLSPPPPSSFADDFEDGSLDAWTIGGRRAAGSNVAEVIQWSGSAQAHLFHSSFTEITLSKDFAYGSDGRLTFRMETSTSSTAGGTSSYYASTGVVINFLNASNDRIGWVSYVRATSTYVLSGCTNDACHVNRLSSDGPTVFDLTSADLLSQISLEEGNIDHVQVSFLSYGSGYLFNLSGDVWVDDFRYSAQGW